LKKECAVIMIKVHVGEINTCLKEYMNVECYVETLKIVNTKETISRRRGRRASKKMNEEIKECIVCFKEIKDKEYHSDVLKDVPDPYNVQGCIDVKVYWCSRSCANEFERRRQKSRELMAGIKK